MFLEGEVRWKIKSVDIGTCMPNKAGIPKELTSNPPPANGGPSVTQPIETVTDSIHQTQVVQPVAGASDTETSNNGDTSEKGSGHVVDVGV